MPRRFATDNAASLGKRFKHIAIPDFGTSKFDIVFFQGALKAEIAHNGPNDGALQSALPLSCRCKNIKELVAVQNLACFIYHHPAKCSKIQDAISQVEGELADSGRVVLRASGTEPVIRVMVEGENESQVINLAERLAAVVAEAAT